MEIVENVKAIPFTVSVSTQHVYKPQHDVQTDVGDVPGLTLPMSKDIKKEQIFPSPLLPLKHRDRADTKGVLKHS